MTTTFTLKTLMLLGLSMVSIHSFAYTSHPSHDDHAHQYSRNSHAVEYRPVKVIQVSHESQRDLHNYDLNKHYNKRDVNPQASWKAGYVLPNQYRTKTYQVARYRSHGLQRPARNQQWFKIKGDYVLVNVVNHRIIRMINGR